MPWPCYERPGCLQANLCNWEREQGHARGNGLPPWRGADSRGMPCFGVNGSGIGSLSVRAQLAQPLRPAGKLRAAHEKYRSSWRGTCKLTATMKRTTEYRRIAALAVMMLFGPLQAQEAGQRNGAPTKVWSL